MGVGGGRVLGAELEARGQGPVPGAYGTVIRGSGVGCEGLRGGGGGGARAGSGEGEGDGGACEVPRQSPWSSCVSLT
jgi:hypothetical protein